MRQQFFTQRHQLLRFFVARFGALCLRRTMAFSTLAKSASANSVPMVSMSAIGSTLPHHDVVVVKAAHHV